MSCHYLGGLSTMCSLTVFSCTFDYNMDFLGMLIGSYIRLGKMLTWLCLQATFTWSLGGFSYCPIVPATNFCNHNDFTNALIDKLKYGTQGSKNCKWLDNKLTLHSSTSNFWKSPLVSSLITTIRSFLYARQQKQNKESIISTCAGDLFWQQHRNFSVSRTGWLSVKSINEESSQEKNRSIIFYHLLFLYACLIAAIS